MSCIHYKFKSSLDYDTITFEDLQVSLKELRDAICKAKKIGQSNDHKLEIVNAQTKKKYEDEQEMIPRNTSVIVQRVPVTVKQGASDKQKIQIFPQSESSKLLSAEEMMINKMTDLATANATEEEKLKVMMSQSSEGFDPAKYPTKPVGGNKQGITGHIRVPPPNYVCFRCGQRGHWLRFCPTQGDARYDSGLAKPIAGVPSSQLVILDHHVPGAMIDRHGNYVMRSVDHEAMLKKSKPSAPVKEVKSVPDELKCSICSELMKDAVIIQCCGESFCDECIREYLLDNDFTCPKCEETDVSPDTLMANKALRTAVKNHQNISKEHRVASHKVLDNLATVLSTAATPTTEQLDKSHVAIAAPTPLCNVTMTTTVSNITNATTVATSTSAAMTTANNKKAALQLVSRLEQNILIKQAASTAAQEVITSDVLESSMSRDLSSVAHVNRSVSPVPPNKQQQQPPIMTHSESTIRQPLSSSSIVQSVKAQSTAVSAPVMSSTGYKPALLPTPAAAAASTAAVAAPTAMPASQLDPLAVAAAAALLLASGTSTTSSTATTAPDPASLLAADQLLQQELNSRSRSPAPLSAEEFYRQQNRLKNKSKRKHSSSTNSSPVRTHKRKHHHHSNKSERKKHKEHKTREEKSSHKHKRKKHHKEADQEDVPDGAFKMPSTRSAVTVVKRSTDPKVSLLAPDLESPLLPPCVQNFTEPPADLLAANLSEQENYDDNVVPTVTSAATTSSESLEDDGIEEGEILESTGTNTPTGSIDPPPLKDNKVRKLKRKSSQSTELSVEKQSDRKLKKRKWKKEKDISGEKKHKIR